MNWAGTSWLPQVALTLGGQLPLRRSRPSRRLTRCSFPLHSCGGKLEQKPHGIETLGGRAGAANMGHQHANTEHQSSRMALGQEQPNPSNHNAIRYTRIGPVFLPARAPSEEKSRSVALGSAEKMRQYFVTQARSSVKVDPKMYTKGQSCRP